MLLQAAEDATENRLRSGAALSRCSTYFVVGWLLRRTLRGVRQTFGRFTLLALIRQLLLRLVLGRCLALLTRIRQFLLWLVFGRHSRRTPRWTRDRSWGFAALKPIRWLLLWLGLTQQQQQQQQPDSEALTGMAHEWCSGSAATSSSSVFSSSIVSSPFENLTSSSSPSPSSTTSPASTSSKTSPSSTSPPSLSSPASAPTPSSSFSKASQSICTILIHFLTSSNRSETSSNTPKSSGPSSSLLRSGSGGVESSSMARHRVCRLRRGVWYGDSGDRHLRIPSRFSREVLGLRLLWSLRQTCGPVVAFSGPLTRHQPLLFSLFDFRSGRSLVSKGDIFTSKA
ncbi:hypothetical protein KC362_g24 [Hortaea werneckii]|nr:hypothetical protein KC362_g24 [Hortaea werneckii]